MLGNNIVETLDEIESEWEKPIGERMIKVLVVAAVGLLATHLTEKGFDRYAARRQRENQIQQDVINVLRTEQAD